MRTDFKRNSDCLYMNSCILWTASSISFNHLGHADSITVHSPGGCMLTVAMELESLWHHFHQIQLRSKQCLADLWSIWDGWLVTCNDGPLLDAVLKSQTSTFNCEYCYSRVQTTVWRCRFYGLNNELLLWENKKFTDVFRWMAFSTKKNTVHLLGENIHVYDVSSFSISIFCVLSHHSKLRIW